MTQNSNSSKMLENKNEFFKTNFSKILLQRQKLHKKHEEYVKELENDLEGS